MKNNLLRNLLAAAGIYYLAQGLLTNVVTNYSNGIEVQFQSAKLRWNPASLNTIRVELSYELRNNNAFSVAVDGFAGQLLYGTHTLGQIILDEPFALEAGQLNDLTLDVYVDLLSLPNEVAALIREGQYLDGMRVKGQVFTSIATIPIDEPIQIIG